MDLFAIVIVSVVIVSVVIGCLIGSSKGQFASGLLWSLLLGPLGILIVLLLPNFTKRAEEAERAKQVLLQLQLQLQKSQLDKLEQILRVAIHSTNQISQAQEHGETRQTAEVKICSTIPVLDQSNCTLVSDIPCVVPPQLSSSDPKIRSASIGQEWGETQMDITHRVHRTVLPSMFAVFLTLLTVANVWHYSRLTSTQVIKSEPTFQVRNRNDVTASATSQIASETKIDDLSAIKECEKDVNDILTLSHSSLPADWSPDACKHFRSVMSNALEIQEVIPSLKDSLVRSRRGDATKKDLTEFYRIRRDWQRLLVQLQARRNQFQTALDVDKEKKRLADAERRRNEDLGVTREAYSGIRDGMSPYDVQAIIGYAFMREEQSSAGSLKMYAWQEGFSTIIATFDDNRLISKTQSGL